MHFNQVSFLFIAATAAIATPQGRDTHARDTGLTQLGSKDTADGGSLEYWGIQRGVELLNARVLWTGAKCVSGTITLVCYNWNPNSYAKNAYCDSLIRNLNGYGSQPVNSSFQGLCYKGEDGKCCTIWSGPVPKLTYLDLATNAQTLAQSCSSSNGISGGKMNGLNIEGTCVNQCLNNGNVPICR